MYAKAFKTFTEDQLMIPSYRWEEDMEGIEDYGQLYNESLIAKFDEEEIICHFIYFNNDKIQSFEKLLNNLITKNALSLNNAFEWFKTEAELFSWKFESEEELIEAINDEWSLMIDVIIGLFRWLVLTEQYEDIKLVEPLIDEITEEIYTKKLILDGVTIIKNEN